MEAPFTVRRFNHIFAGAIVFTLLKTPASREYRRILAGKFARQRPVSRSKENADELTTISRRHLSSKSVKYVVSVVCQQDVSRDCDPTSVVADERIAPIRR
jgi:hypothetical protein